MSYPFAHPSLDADPFVRVRVAPHPPRDRGDDASADLVLLRRDEPLRPDALVVAHDAGGLALRRVGWVHADVVELLPVAADADRCRTRADAGAVVGTVVMRWHAVAGA